MDIRPRLTSPRSPLLRRPDGSIQLGVGPTAVHLHQVHPDEAAWLTSLDGSRALAGVLDAAAAQGIARDRAAELVDRLAAAGHLELCARRSVAGGRVLVVGRGGLPALLADVLSHTGSAEVRRLHDPALLERAGEFLIHRAYLAYSFPSGLTAQVNVQNRVALATARRPGRGGV